MKQWLLECSRWEEYGGEGEYVKDYVLVSANSLDEAISKAREEYSSGYNFYLKNIE